MADDQYTNQDGPEITLPSNAAFSAEQFHIVVLNTDGRVVIADDADVNGEPMLGILQNKPKAQDDGAVVRIRDICKVMGGASLNEGIWVTTDGNGHAVAAVTNDQAIGFTIDTMTDGEVSRILISRLSNWVTPS